MSEEIEAPTETKSATSRVVKVVVILFAVYVAIVVVFESLLGYYQPSNEGTLVITTMEDDGTPHDRVLSRIESDDQLYVAVNHWPRAWYWRLLDNPGVKITMGDNTADYTAVEVMPGAEYDRVNGARPLGPVFRILTGFPPRRIIRLDPA